MDLVMIGLGKMGLNMATRLVRGGHHVVGYDPSPQSLQAATQNGVVAANSLADAFGKLQAPRVAWLMIPAGQATDEAVGQLAALLQAGDIVVDGGNSNYKETIKHAAVLEARGIDFVDSGTSGGIWGLEEGYSLML